MVGTAISGHSTHMLNPIGIIVFLVLWIALSRCAHLLLVLFRHGRLLGWAIGPLGVTLLTLHEPSLFYIWLNVLIPALVSAIAVYVGLFTTLSPLMLPHRPLIEAACIVIGILLTSTGDFLTAVWDTRFPLWGEVRILRTIHILRATWAKIHLTPFGMSYLSSQFGFQPADILKVF